MKKLWILCLAVVTAIVLAACGGDKDETVIIGVNGADGVQWPILTEKAAKEGIKIKLQEFADYTLPNNALAQGDIDMNAFQHIAFLGQYAQETGNDLIPIGSTQFAPLGIYSEKLKDVTEIKDGDKIAIPDDPSNQARALRLLESAGLLTLADDFGMFGDPSKIAENPLNLEIIPMVAQQTPRVLPDVAVAIINNGIAGQAGFSPGEDPIYKESDEDDSSHPYVNIIAVDAKNKDNETFKRIVELYQEEDIVKAIEEDTKGGSYLVKLTQEELDAAFKNFVD